MPWWADAYKIVSNAFRDDPISQSRSDIEQVGVSQPDGIPDVRQENGIGGGEKGLIRISSTQNDFIDLSTVTNRLNRYREYERLRNVSEIETAMRTFANEACIAGSEIVNTLYYGPVPIRWLAENKANEKFLVYCWDFKKNDYSLGWAYNPRFVKKSKTVKIQLDNGTSFVCTDDHRILMDNNKWINAGDLKFGDRLKPFYRLKPNIFKNKLKYKQYYRVFTTEDSWKSERQFINEWRDGQKDTSYNDFNKISRVMAAVKKQDVDLKKLTSMTHNSCNVVLKKHGFTMTELVFLTQKANILKNNARKVVGISKYDEKDVYDLSVEEHENFCGESVIFHNCQTDDKNNVIQIEAKNKYVKEELEWLFFNRKMLNVNRNLWNWYKNLFVFGDLFLEVVYNLDNPKDGVAKIAMLPPESMYRIETAKGRLIEFQQSKNGPDYQALTRGEVTRATNSELLQSEAGSRFTPEQIVHVRVGEDRKTFYPYGISLIEPARGPAHQLRLMEDGVMVNRLSRSPERRIIYLNTGNMPPAKIEALVQRMQDLFRKKKVATNRSNQLSASSVEERWSPPSSDEDIWIPMRNGDTVTRIETLPSASNLDQIEDVKFFREKLYKALNMPMPTDDPNATRITLSVRDANFARFVERLQAPMEDGLLQIAERHLELRGFPEEIYRDLKITSTPPSPWRELSLAEVLTNRINNATALINAQVLSRYDAYIDYFKYSEDEALAKLSRLKLERLEDLKLQIMGQNPELFGVGIPGDNEQEIGTEAEGPNPNLTPEEKQQTTEEPEQIEKPIARNIKFSKPLQDDIKRFDLEIQGYAQNQDQEDIDYSNLD